MGRIAFLASALLLAGRSAGQQPGHQKKEGAPVMTRHHCSEKLCKTATDAVVLDASWRRLQENKGSKTCYKADGEWEPDLCPDPDSCAANCELSPVTATEYADRYGVSAHNNGIRLRYASVTKKTENYGTRVFLLKGDKYKLFHLKNREIAIDVDASKLPCGLRASAVLVEMDEEGSKVGGNAAGAKYGTGYCDATCPKDVKFVAGEVNMLDWHESHGTNVGRFGSCCAEFDIWEGNSQSFEFAAHPCSFDGQTRCKGRKCGPNNRAVERLDTPHTKEETNKTKVSVVIANSTLSQQATAGNATVSNKALKSKAKKGKKAKKHPYGPCDAAGCDFNAYRLGETNFYGAGDDFAVDSRHRFTVVTQFITSDGTDDGDLVEIRRFYVHKGNVVDNVAVEAGDSLTNGFCKKERHMFKEVNHFHEKGGMAQLGAALSRGMVLALSIRDDPKDRNRWIDSKFPRKGKHGGSHRGPCEGGDDSSPDNLRANSGDATVTFTNLVYGDIGTTFKAGRHLMAGSYV